jgi:hypothetical protein
MQCATKAGLQCLILLAAVAAVAHLPVVRANLRALVCVHQTVQLLCLKRCSRHRLLRATILKVLWLKQGCPDLQALPPAGPHMARCSCPHCCMPLLNSCGLSHTATAELHGVLRVCLSCCLWLGAPTTCQKATTTLGPYNRQFLYNVA